MTLISSAEQEALIASERRWAWLEDQTDPAATAWVGEQNAVSGAWFDAAGDRQMVHERMRAALEREQRTSPMIRGGKTFELRKSAGDEQYSLWIVDGTDARLLIDARELDPEGRVAITHFEPSPDGR